MKQSILIPTAALGAALFAAGCGGGDEPLEAAKAKPARAAQVVAPAGRIAFRRYLDASQGHGAVFTINTDGTDEQRVTRPAEGIVDDQPDWSPDGKRIAFERCPQEQPCSVWTVNADGSHPAKVRVYCKLGPICDATGPAWASNGQLVVGLAQGREKSHGEFLQIERFSVELIDLERRTQRTVVARDHWTGDTHEPTISPDGRTVVYVHWNSWKSKPANGRALFAVGIRGDHHRRLTPWKLRAGDHPVFSTDGKQVLFRSFWEEDEKQSDYWTVAPDTRKLTRLTHFKQGTTVLSGSYSPNSQWIVHATDGVDGQADVFVMRADGSANTPVTRTKAWDSAPDWGP